MADWYIDINGKISKKKKETDFIINEKGEVTQTNIAPVESTEETKGGNKDSWFKSGGFSDGVDGFWDFVGDLGQTVAGTAGDIAVGVGKGITRMGEGVTDLAGYGLAGLSDLVGAENFADDVRNVAKDNTTDKLWKKPTEFVDQYSVLGNKADSVSEGLGQVGGILATAGLAGALGASGAVASGVSTGVVGTSAMGSGMSEAYEEGATDKEAVTYGTISGVSEAITEAIFGGLGKTVKALGVSKGLSSADDMLAKKVSGMFNKQIAKNFAEFGIKAGAEGTEEVLSGIMQAAGKSFTYMKDNEEGKDFWDILKDENLLEQFVVGTVTSGIAQSGVVPGMKNGSLSEANKQGKDFITGLTENEQKVVDKEVENRIKQAEDNGKTITNKQKNKIYDEVVEDLDKGGISIDTIESALGGDTYKSYQDIVDKEDALLKEYEELGNKANATPKDNMRYQELDKLIKENKNNNQKATLKNQLADEVYEIAKDSRLAESYNEKTRKSQKYEADLSKYDEKQQAIVKKAIDSGILNNTNKTHDFVDLVAKMAADKDLDFDFTNNENLKKSGFSLEGKIINGYIKDGKIGVNIDSSKSLNSVVGHEITHVLEGTELYNELHKVVKEYAISKNEYKTRYDDLDKIYRNKEGKLIENANIENEVVADLVGDYLFTDRDFVNNLSAKNPNIFKKIFDEIKYFCKIATAGSTEARQLEKIKRTFEKTYKQNVSINNDTKYSYSGIRAKTADSSLLFKAENMLKNGIDSETVRKETGWFKGLDGKMRFEIDDSKMKVYPNGDLEFRKAHPEYAELQELKEKQSKSELTEEELVRLNKLDDIWENEFNRLNEQLRKGNLKLSDIIEHDKLFDNYPELKDIDIKIDSLEDGYRGVHNQNEKSITINEKLLEEDTSILKKTLIHEIQHAIQSIEEFTNGSSEKYWQDKLDNGQTIKTSKQKEELQKLKKEYSNISKSEPKFVKEMNELEEMTPTVDRGAYDFETFEQIEEDPIEWQNFDKQRDLLSEKYGEDKVFDFMDLQYNIKDLEKKGITAYEAYYKTAGEIEARDTAQRLFLNEEQRKDTRPDIDKNDVMFSDNKDIQYSLSDIPDGYSRLSDLEKYLDNFYVPKDFIYAIIKEGDIVDEVEFKIARQEIFKNTTKRRLNNKSLVYNGWVYSSNHMFYYNNYSETGFNVTKVVNIEDYNTEIEYEEVYDASKVKRIGESVGDRNEGIGNRQRNGNSDGSFTRYGSTSTGIVGVSKRGATNRRSSNIQEVGNNNRTSKIAPTNNEVSSKDDAFFDAADNTKKSLSMNEVSSIKDKTYGNYNVYGKDVALVNDTVTENNIAPIIEDNSAKTSYNSLNTNTSKSTNEFNPYAKEVSEDDIETVSSDELRESKLENAQIEVDNLIQHRESSYKSYSDKIEQLQQEYDSKKNKDTKVANTLLQRIERLKRSREDTDTKYKKDIGDRQNKLELIKKGYPTKRSEVQGKIIDDIKIELNKNNVDLDDALLNGKNLSAIKINDNTPQRVFEKTFGSKVGRILSDLTVNKVARNETESIKWLNKYTNRKDGVLKELSDRYKIKPGSKESAAAQMYAEGFYVDRHNKIVKYGDAELAKDFPDFEVRNRIIGLAKNPMIRQIYDETLDMINESRQRNGYPAIPKLENYYLHFRAMEDTFSKLGLPFNPNSIKANDLPTDLNGVTADLQPGQPYFASANHRKGKRTTFDLLGGLEMYLSGAKNQIYHIDDIQTFRSLRNYIADMFGQAKGLENLDELEDNQIEEMIDKIYGSHLSNFARFLNEEANVIAGKTALIDRGLEGAIGRKGMAFMSDLNSQVGSHMVGGNISSSLTNFLVITDAFSKSNKADFFKAFTQMVSNKVNSLKGKSDGFVENNPTMIRRNGAETFNRTAFQKISDVGYVLMGVVDNISTELVTRTKYNECIRKGMTSEQAMNEADKWASRMMGDRSLGQQPLIYNSKTFGMFTKFQLEVRNFLDSALYDNIQDAKLENEDIKNGIARNAKTATKVTSTLIQLAIGQHLFGKAFEKMAGYNPAFDVIETIIKTFGLDDDDESEDTVADNIEQGLMSLLEDLPYSSLITNGGRIPVTTALPFNEIFNQDNFSNKSFLERTGDAIKEVAPYYLLPTGYGQIKKTMKGLEMFDEDLPLPGSYTESGNLRFTVEDTPANRIKAGLFGQWANENAREYFDSGSDPLKSKQIQELKELDIPIKDYRKYKKDISSKKGISDKADYINELDLPIDKKNILVNNAVNRKKKMDMTNYNDFSNFEEFDFYNNNPKKYNLLKENNVSYKEYSSNEDTKKAYNWAYNNPDKYVLAKSVTDDVVAYKQYTKEIHNIKADTYANGKTVTGSRKNNVTDYINSLELDYGQKIILYRKEFDKDDTYNNEIIEYVGSRQDLSFENKATILTQLGFTVKKDGTVLWD